MLAARGRAGWVRVSAAEGRLRVHQFGESDIYENVCLGVRMMSGMARSSHWEVECRGTARTVLERLESDARVVVQGAISRDMSARYLVWVRGRSFVIARREDMERENELIHCVRGRVSEGDGCCRVVCRFGRRSSNADEYGLGLTVVPFVILAVLVFDEPPFTTADGIIAAAGLLVLVVWRMQFWRTRPESMIALRKFVGEVFDG